MDHLFEKLCKYAESDMAPCHMPGHKRRGWGELPESLYALDITEIDGFDNLHQPTGILDRLQKEAAALYGAEESFYLINGSTCGILSAVSAALPARGHILMARNCHRSAYHAAYLRNLSVSYLYPPFLEEFDIFDAVTPRQVEAALEVMTPGAVLIVSPTYEGRISDVRAIAGIVHRKGIPLIVDEAHGAHLGLAEGFAENSCQAGADLVIHSVHKTLPALTQTALLHVNGSLICRHRLKRFLGIYQSSSPSYPLMASIDNALRYAAETGKERFAAFRRQYGEMQEALKECRYLKFLYEEPDRQDIGKLFIYTGETEFTGKQVYDMLLCVYCIQAEMASSRYVLAMFTVNDDEEIYRRITSALLDIDQKAGELGTYRRSSTAWADGKRENLRQPHKAQNPQVGTLDREKEILGEWSRQYNEAESIPLARAWDMESETAALEDSAGRYAAEFINLYPPGVPLLVPGERITEEMCREIRECAERGLTLQGIDSERTGQSSAEEIWIRVLKDIRKKE